MPRRNAIVAPHDATPTRHGAPAWRRPLPLPLAGEDWGEGVAIVLAVSALAGCANWRGGSPDNEPTLRTLAARSVTVEKDAVAQAGDDQAIEAYRQFLAATAKTPQAPQRAEAMRRIGDLEMASADAKSAADAAAPAADYRAAITRYEAFLKEHPGDPSVDRVLYQLARAHEQKGNLETALGTLDRLVREHPQTRYRDEAEFRRGELLFTARDYPGAEKAYATVLAKGDKNAYHDRALYMHGWSVYKQGRHEDALRSFFGVLDLKLAGKSGEPGLTGIPDLTRAERELVEDTFRVASIGLANLNGAESIASLVESPQRRGYEFRVYEQLGELYLKQERAKDAADAFALYARKHPLDAQAPLLQARVVEIYEKTSFSALALEAKKEYVARYGRASEFEKANPDGWRRAQPLVKTHLAELARHYHASAQQSKASADVDEAVRWYREVLRSFPDDVEAARQNFLLAELLFEVKRFAEATAEYEKVAYGYPAHAKSADAGYAALLGYARQLELAPAAGQPALQRASVASALRFAAAQPADPRAGAVLADAADKLYALHDADQAAAVAQRVLERKPPAADAERRVAWTVLAHTQFEANRFDRAEASYAEVLKLVPEKEAARADLVERQAASIYKQAERARAEGRARDAVASFARVGTVAPQSTVRAAAQYDAAATLLAMKDWDAAAKALEDFRQRYPGHALQAEVGGKLAVAYIEKGEWAGAAGELERLAASSNDPKVARDATWQAAEYYDKANARASAAKAYERYVGQYGGAGQPLEPAVEARWRLAKIARQDGNGARQLALLREIQQADQAGGGARTDRTRYLGATAALALVEPVVGEYRKVALVEPLPRQLKLKKTKMEETVKAYAVAAEYGVAEVTTAATYGLADVYRDFGKAIIASERPKKLSKVEREQYDVLLEEQAFPFEEKATELHETNARRAAEGVFDKWVKASFDALRELRPVRWGKSEVSDKPVDAGRLAEQASELEAALRREPRQPAALNRLAIAYRHLGRFAQARETYEKAIVVDPAYAPATLNLGILHDLYLGDRARALELYDRYLALSPAGDAQVAKWVAELKNRKAAPITVSRKEKE